MCETKKCRAINIFPQFYAIVFLPGGKQYRTNAKKRQKEIPCDQIAIKMSTKNKPVHI